MCLVSDFFLLIFIGSFTFGSKYTLNNVITPPTEVCTDRHEAEQTDLLSEDERDLGIHWVQHYSCVLLQ